MFSPSYEKRIDTESVAVVRVSVNQLLMQCPKHRHASTSYRS
jgi:hypothetical protein